MPGQGGYPQRGWYDEIMQGQYYDEIIPAYEAQQEQMAASGSSLFLLCLRGLSFLCTTLLARVRREGRPPLPPTVSSSEEAILRHDLPCPSLPVGNAG
jgi:hypothetical protein